MRVKRIQKFLKSLSDEEWIYLKKTQSVASAMKDFIRDFKMTKETFCRELKIKESDYEDVISGSWEYDLRVISTFDAVVKKYITNKINKNE